MAVLEDHSRMILSCGSPKYTRYILLCRQSARGADDGEVGRTPNMFLLRGSLIRAGGLFDVNHQLLLGLVFVHWTSGVVYLIISINVKAVGTSPVRPKLTKSAGLHYIRFVNSTYMSS